MSAKCKYSQNLNSEKLKFEVFWTSVHSLRVNVWCDFMFKKSASVFSREKIEEIVAKIQVKIEASVSIGKSLQVGCLVQKKWGSIHHRR